MRVKGNTTFQRLGGCRQPAPCLIPGPGYAWVGRSAAFRQPKVHRCGTLMVVWGHNQQEPWLVLTDLAPEDVGACWYGLRVWIELGFRALKGVGWQWQHTRRTNPERVSRHWLVLVVAMLWILAYGTRAEDAANLGLPPGRVLKPPPHPSWVQRRRVSIFRQGRSWLTRQLLKGRLWQRLWLEPEPWPALPDQLKIIRHAPT